MSGLRADERFAWRGEAVILHDEFSIDVVVVEGIQLFIFRMR